MAHVSVHLQSSLGYKSVKHYAVDTSLLHYEGIKLFNPDSKEVKVRRTFKLIGPNSIVPLSDVYHCNIDDSDIMPAVPLSVHTPIVSDSTHTLEVSHRDDDDNLLYTTTRVGTIDFEGS